MTFVLPHDYSFKQALRATMHASGPLVICGVHDCLSAKVAAEYAFDAVWVSSLGVSLSAYGKPDDEGVAASHYHATAVTIRDSTSLPAILDAGTGNAVANGHGALLNVAKSAHWPAICVEDVASPKRSTIYESYGLQRVVGVTEFTDKLGMLVQDARYTGAVIARTDAVFAGEAPESVASRVMEYAEAGADAVLVHSDSLESLRAVLQKVHKLDIPIFSLPTLFPEVQRDDLASLGVGGVIYANQAIRACLGAMRDVLGGVCADRLDRHPLTPVFALEEIAGADR